jgi:hypothetical protein
MRARPRPLAIAAATAAVTVASLPLWASTAGAGAPPDEEHQSVRTVIVGGVSCEVRLYSFRYSTGVYGSTQVLTTADQCRTTQMYVNVEFLSASGDTVSASADDPGPTVDVAGGGATDLVRSYHGVTFALGSSATWTMSAK